MKNLAWAICFFLIGMAHLSAQDSDYDLVEQTLNYYLDGGTNNEFETLEKAFHPNASMKFIGENYTEVNAVDFFRDRMKPGPAQNRKTRIISVSITGNAANAQLEIEYPTFYFIDYMNLLKIDGEWKIVNKIFYKKNKEALSQ